MDIYNYPRFENGYVEFCTDAVVAEEGKYTLVVGMVYRIYNSGFSELEYDEEVQVGYTVINKCVEKYEMDREYLEKIYNDFYQELLEDIED